jgi:uncharacterized protein YlxP (DUF503 family)
VRVLIMSLDLHLPGCRSLKARRGLLEPLKSRLRRDLNLSVSEVEPRHSHDRARLGIACVVDHRAAGDAQRSRIEAIVERLREVTLLECEVEYW